MRSFSLAHWPTSPCPIWNASESVVSLVDRVSGQQLQHGVRPPRVGDIEGAVLRADQRRQFGEQQLRDGQQVALALHHAGELRDVGLQPVLLVVLARGGRKIHDHLVDVVL